MLTARLETRSTRQLGYIMNRECGCRVLLKLDIFLIRFLFNCIDLRSSPVKPDKSVQLNWGVVHQTVVVGSVQGKLPTPY